MGNQPGVSSNEKAARNQRMAEPGPAAIRTAEDAMNILKARVSQRLEQQLGSVSANRPSRFASPAFEAPSAEIVAQTVLGFVQQRLQAEASAGADANRLAGLLADARAGVEKGFAEAREQIEALGLMDERLGAGIDESYNRIQNGLSGLSEQFVQRQPESAVSAATETPGYRIERASELLFSSEVTTEEGDRLIGQVEKVSTQFFDGNVQSAFQKAQTLNLGGEALASFSLSLTSTRIVSASAYESVAQQPSANTQLRPLVGLARDLQSVAQSAFERGVSEPAFEGFLDSLLQDMGELQRQREDAPALASDSLISDFIKAVIQSLNSPLPQ